MNDRLKSAVAGAFAGLINGFIGSGGGMLLVPLLNLWIGLDSKKSFATSLAITLPVSIVSAVVYLITDTLRFSDAIPYLAGGLVGGIIAGKVFRKVPSGILRSVLGLLVIYGGIRCLL